jgi:hypothetical protein
LVDSVVSKALSAAPFVAIGAWIAVQWMRSKNAALDAKILKLETEKQEAKNAQAIKEKFDGKSDSDVIDHAINSGSKVP